MSNTKMTRNTQDVNTPIAKLAQHAQHHHGSWPELEQSMQNALGEALSIMEAEEAEYALRQTANKMTWALDSLRTNCADLLHKSLMDLKQIQSATTPCEVTKYRIEDKYEFISNLERQLAMFESLFQGAKRAHDTYSDTYITEEQRRQAKRKAQAEARHAVSHKLAEYADILGSDDEPQAEAAE